MSESVALDVELKSPIERVWHALTNAAMLSKWMLFETTDFRAVVGNKFQLRMESDDGQTMIVHCEVLEVDEPRRLSYTWEGGPKTNVVHTKVTWTLAEAENGGTRLHLEQSGFSREAKLAIGGAKYGWTRMLEQLRHLLASAKE